MECTSLENPPLGKGLKIISPDAFCQCNALRTLTIPEGVEKICGSAFAACANLEYVTGLWTRFPDEKMTIEDGAFSECRRLKEVLVGKNVTLGPKAFPAECRITLV